MSQVPPCVPGCIYRPRDAAPQGGQRETSRRMRWPCSLPPPCLGWAVGMCFLLGKGLAFPLCSQDVLPPPPAPHWRYPSDSPRRRRLQSQPSGRPSSMSDSRAAGHGPPLFPPRVRHACTRLGFTEDPGTPVCICQYLTRKRK